MMPTALTVPVETAGGGYQGRSVDRKHFDTLLEMYRRTDLSEERRNILRALGVVDDLALLRRALE